MRAEARSASEDGAEGAETAGLHARGASKKSGSPGPREGPRRSLRLRDVLGRDSLRAVQSQLGADVGLSDAESLVWMAIFAGLLLGSFALGRWLPPLTAFLSGPQLYTPANFVYAPNVKFDDTWLTYGTDYGLAVVMSFFALAMNAETRTSHNARLMETGSTLLGSYAVSTLAGALAHQFLPGKLHTSLFRLVWKICVGAVGAAGGIMGATASALARLPTNETSLPRFRILVVPDFCWTLWSVFFLIVIFTNRFSMAQPACDIFLTGVTQTIPTMYLVLVLFSRRSWANVHVDAVGLAILVYGALANIALLPAYDVLNFANLPLGVTNALMHAWLCAAWGSQGYGLWRFVKGASAPQ
ncbi:Hypothetical Protein FCC1311_079842 [Hondaea fermentalgiana]|uniref:Uncharacterized protein n=1 Tax=Hondaea fermentalgiana TaxID=2315210 RepID=A0A2R5GN85_9STRA|nr:Hypothetical Protein FCC1311_079842 [Hondaea fermentalgiana]|eukprot:GBG31759.1 Hypothetical Protein FCC1311_079842 [Hondaea fermentalgiana]